MSRRRHPPRPLDRLDEPGHIGGVVLEVAVLYDHDVPLHVCDRGPDRGAFPAVREAEDEKVLALRAAGEQLRRGVGRAVVGDDHLHVQVKGLHTVEQLLGSFNLSHSGEISAENVLKIHDPALAERLAGYVDSVRARYPVASLTAL